MPNSNAHAPIMLVSPEDVTAALYAPGSSEQDTRSNHLRAMLQGVTALLRSGQFSEFDGILAALRPDDLSPSMATGVLRYSFAAREVLPNWGTARDRVRASLVRRGEDADDILSGL